VKIGQWGLSNEPAEHMQSMWLFTDKPEEAARYTRMGMQQAGGSIQVGRGMMGEEDNGSMASWWVWAYIGLYPLDQGSGTVVLGSPRFKKVTFNLDDGRSFTFLAPNAGPQNCYVNGIKFNGEPYNKLYFTQDMFADDNVFEFDMGAEPSGWARTAEPPPSLTEGEGRDFEPTIMMDIIPIGVDRNTALPSNKSAAKQVTVTGITAANAAYLFDNSSVTTDAQFTGNTGTITYYSPAPVKVEMYTLTSSNADGADPKTWRLEGSNDGSAWTTLDSRSLPNIRTFNNAAVTTVADAGTKTSETFRWRRQTKPFAIDPANQGSYKYYRLNITASSSTAAMRLAQFELLAEQPRMSLSPALAKSGNNVTVSSSVINNTMSAKSVLVYAALYRADGKMVDVATRNVNNVPAISSSNLSSNIVFNVENAGDDYYVKVFLWEPTTFIPLAADVTLW